jgi:hypothetical protein
VLVLVFLSSCALPRVSLPPPPPREAPLSERAQAYEYLKPVSAERTTWTQGGATVGVDERLLLAGGLTVYDPEDLVPIVGAGSPTGQATARWIKKSEYNTTLSHVVAGVTLASLVLMFWGGYDWFSAATASPPRQSLGGYAMGVGFLSLLLTPLVARILRDDTAFDDRTAAFTLYGKDLRERLGLKLVLDDAAAPSPADAPVRAAPTKPAPASKPAKH